MISSTDNAGRMVAAAAVGVSGSAIRTPALVIDLDAMQRNLAAMAAFARQRGLRLRPHAKMHKSAQLARLQMEAGAVGVCVQKLSEAQALAAGGIDDIFISNEIIDESKLAEVAALAGLIRLAICVDSAIGIERLAAAMRQAGGQIDVLIELDVGQGRCGVPADEVGPLAELLLRHSAKQGGGLSFAGIQAYHGSAQHLRSDAERQLAIERACALVRRALAGLAKRNISCPLVTGAGTGSFFHEAASGLYGELQAGSYLFMDADYAANNATADVPQFEHALFIKSQVISRQSDRAIIDAGHKSHAVDSGMPLVWQRRLVYSNGGDEHGILNSSGGAALPELGDIVWLVPGHCDPTVNLHDHYIGVRGGLDSGTVEAVWRVDGRGCIR